MNEDNSKYYRSIFISDVHLGTKDSKTDELLEFIRIYECENLFLVGDIIDGWSLKRGWLWKQGHSDVIQKILRKARKGTKVFYILGNHDEFVRPFLPVSLGDNIQICNEYEYRAANNKKYLITHGDFFDSVTLTKKWLAVLGDVGYQWLLRLNRGVNIFRRVIGYKRYWSLSKFVKDNVKKAISFINDYENVIVEEAKRRDFNGVICGHIHKADIKKIQDIEYINCGDWVESCSAILERTDGTFEKIEDFTINSS